MSRGAVEKVELGKGEEAKAEKLPKAVPLILCNAFLERFCSGGIFGEIFDSFNTDSFNQLQLYAINSDPCNFLQSKASLRLRYFNSFVSYQRVRALLFLDYWSDRR